MSVTATALSVTVNVKLSRCRRTAVGVLEVRRWTRLLTGSWNSSTSWKKWPHLSGWAGSLWTMLSAELAERAAALDDPDQDEIGESG